MDVVLFAPTVRHVSDKHKQQGLLAAALRAAGQIIYYHVVRSGGLDSTALHPLREVLPDLGVCFTGC